MIHIVVLISILYIKTYSYWTSLASLLDFYKGLIFNFIFFIFFDCFVIIPSFLLIKTDKLFCDFYIFFKHFFLKKKLIKGKLRCNFMSLFKDTVVSCKSNMILYKWKKINLPMVMRPTVLENWKKKSKLVLSWSYPDPTLILPISYPDPILILS